MTLLCQFLAQSLHHVLIAGYQTYLRNCLHIAKAYDLTVLFCHPQTHDGRAIRPSCGMRFTLVPEELWTVNSDPCAGEAFFLLVPQFQDAWQICANRVAPDDCVHW